MDEALQRVELSQLTPEEVRRQAFLFDEVDVGHELLTIEQDRAANKHTGTTLDKRTELRDEICMRLCDGVSVRKVAKRYGVGRNTVAALVELLQTSGRMEPYKKRMARKLGQLVESGTDLLQERIDSGDIPTNAIPVAVGIAFDKRALLEGEPTAILAQAGVEKFSQAKYDEWLRQLPQAQVTEVRTADSQSTGKDGKGQ